MADQHQRIALLGKFDRLNVDLGDQRAGGVNHLEIAAFAALAHRRRNAVGRVDDALAVRHVVDLVDKDRALFRQLIHNIAVMDNFAAHVDGRAKGFKGDLDDVDRAHHSGAKAARLEQQHPLLTGGSARDDLIQLGRQMVEFGFAERDPGQPRQVRDLVTGNGHARDSRVRCRRQAVSNNAGSGDFRRVSFVLLWREADRFMSADVKAAVDAAFRDEWGRVVATLIRTTGDWDLAEECAQDAFAMALQRWPSDGIPGRPGAWLTTAARNRAIDVLRRRTVGAAKLREVAATVAA